MNYNPKVNAEAVRIILSEDKTAMDKYIELGGSSMLYAAFMNDKPQAIEHLLSVHHLDPDMNKGILMFISIEHNKFENVKLLVENGAQLFKEDSAFIKLAVYEKYYNIAKYLLFSGSKIDIDGGYFDVFIKDSIERKDYDVLCEMANLGCDILPRLKNYFTEDELDNFARRIKLYILNK